MKKILIIFSLILVLAVPMRAQVFIMEEDENERVDKVFGNGQWGNIIYHGSGDDQTNYLPVGNGVLLLAGMGGAYLLRRKTKEKDS